MSDSEVCSKLFDCVLCPLSHSFNTDSHTGERYTLICSVRPSFLIVWSIRFYFMFELKFEVVLVCEI